MDNAELIAVLRCCGKEGGCLDCPLLRKPSDACFQLAADAADLIEAQQAALEECAKQFADMAAKLKEERNKTVTEIFLEEQLWWEDRCKELEAERMELIAKCRRLEAQLPKEGEWIEDTYSPGHNLYTCSACCLAMITTPDYAEKHHYCYGCGAKNKVKWMKGEQE